MKNSLPKFFILFLPMILSVSSCSDFRKALGKEKVMPDEFLVATTPSLIVPPGYKIDPDKIENVIDNKIQSNTLSSKLNIRINKKKGKDNNFLRLFNSGKIPKNIREIVDEETLGIGLSERTGIDILFGNIPSTGIVIDPKKEALRIRKNKASGIKIDAGSTPAVDKNSGKTINIQ